MRDGEGIARFNEEELNAERAECRGREAGAAAPEPGSNDDRERGGQIGRMRPKHWIEGPSDTQGSQCGNGRNAIPQSCRRG